MRTLLVAAVHNGELDGSPARTVIDDLREVDLAQRVIEIQQQPPFVDEVDVDALIEWRRQQAAREIRWRAYLGDRRRWRRLATRAAVAAFNVRVRTSRAFAGEQWRIRQVERFVTAKHIAAWRAFDSATEDELLVIESDATVQPRTFTGLRQLVDQAPTEARYVNLAGGLDLHALGVEEHIATRGPGEIRFERPVTNTSCGYLVNHPLVRRLLDFIDENPDAESAGIDWLFNECFMTTQREGLTVVCIHADPPVLGHGSLMGATESWHPHR